MKPELKKLLLLNLPYLLFVYLFAKCGQAYRLAAGADASAKLLHLTSGISAAFANPLPSLHPFDLCVGVVGAVAVRLIVYSKANPHGKMTVKQLAAKDKGLQSIEVTDQNIGSFNRIARKYGIDFAPFKVKGEKRYMVFFKAPDADAMTAAFKEYTAKQVRKAERPSVLEKLQHFKSLIQAAVVDRAKRKELER